MEASSGPTSDAFRASQCTDLRLRRGILPFSVERNNVLLTMVASYHVYLTVLSDAIR